MELLRGVVHGRMIELENESGLPDGQSVTVVVQPTSNIPECANDPRYATGLRRAFGAWADDAVELDEYLEWNRRQRNINDIPMYLDSRSSIG